MQNRGRRQARTVKNGNKIKIGMPGKRPLVKTVFFNHLFITRKVSQADVFQTAAAPTAK